MRVSSTPLLCALLSSVALAQAPPPRPATPPLIKADANSPANAGRLALSNYLNAIAASDEAARRAEIATINTRAQAEVRQQQVRHKLLDLMGGGFTRTPLNAKVPGSTQLDGFRIEKILYESQPNLFVTALLYMPDPPQSSGAPFVTASSSRVGSNKLPAIVMAPGHGPTGKASDFSMASTFARNGFAVLSYDPIGQGERLQYPSPQQASSPGTPSPDPAHPGQSLATRPTGEHGEAGLQPTLIGDAVGRYFLWDGMRAVDYLLTRPEIDPGRVGQPLAANIPPCCCCATTSTIAGCPAGRRDPTSLRAGEGGHRYLRAGAETIATR